MVTKPEITLDQDIITDTEGASKILGIKVSTLVKWRSTGENNIPFIKIGRLVKYRTADLRAYVELHRVGGAA